MAIKNGKLSFGLMPLLIIFSGRNNLLTSLTAIPYTSLMFYHKWVARIMVIHVILHGAFWTAYAVEHGHLAHYIQEEYWKWGMIATAIVGLLVFQSFHMFKRLSYEVFYILHIILAVAFMLGCFYHCYELGYMEWIYVSCSLWGLDKLTRIVRIILFGVKNAEIKYISDETIRVSVKRNRLFKPFPGAYAFIYFMTPFQFWQSHPFTIINSVHDKDSIVCYVKVKGGITKTLRRKLQKAPGMTVQMKVLVEGPYGHRPPLEKFDSVLLLSGGTGISGLFSHALNLAHHGLSSVKTIHLVWAIKNQESLSWFATELKQLVGSNVKIDIYITGEVSSFPKFEEEEEDDDDEEFGDFVN
jgi:ferric-chelate reductase